MDTDTELRTILEAYTDDQIGELRAFLANSGILGAKYFSKSDVIESIVGLAAPLVRASPNEDALQEFVQEMRKHLTTAE